MRSRTITLRPGESFVTADGLTVEARTEEQERREQASLDRIQDAHAAAFQVFDKAREQVLAQRAMESVQQALSDPSITELSAPRAISITDLDDRIVIEVGCTQLRLSHEEAARLFARGRDFGSKPQA